MTHTLPRALPSLVLATAIVVIALIGPALSPQSPTASVGVPFALPSTEHLLGTDVLGRDTLSRVLHGGQTLVIIALGATVAGSLVGVTVGLWSAVTTRRTLAKLVSRTIDMISALPAVLLMLLLAAGFPGSDLMLAIAIAFVSVPFSVRIIRERAAHVHASDAARTNAARGDSLVDRLRFDIVPAVATVAFAEAGIRCIAATQLAATAGFLGLGAGAPAAQWGRMIRENLVGVTMSPFAVVVPAVLLVLLAITITGAIDRLERRRVLGDVALAEVR